MKAWLLGLALLGCGSDLTVYPSTSLRAEGVPLELLEEARDQWFEKTGRYVQISADGIAPVGFASELPGGLLDCRPDEARVAGDVPIPCTGRTVINFNLAKGAWWVGSVTLWDGSKATHCQTMNQLLHEMVHVIAETE